MSVSAKTISYLPKPPAHHPTSGHLLFSKTLTSAISMLRGLRAGFYAVGNKGRAAASHVLAPACIASTVRSVCRVGENESNRHTSRSAAILSAAVHQSKIAAITMADKGPRLPRHGSGETTLDQRCAAAAMPTVIFALMGGRASAAVRLRCAAPSVFSQRSFSTTSRCQASEPAPNVAPVTESSDPADAAIATLSDPAVYGWWPSSFAELGIVAVHEATGFPWWQCIAAITLTVRMMLLPLVVFQVHCRSS